MTTIETISDIETYPRLLHMFLNQQNLSTSSDASLNYVVVLGYLLLLMNIDKTCIERIKLREI